jgi:hypothetical protein
MEEENVNDFTKVAIPEYAGSLSAAILPGFFAGVEKIGQGQANLAARESDKKRTVSGMSEDFEPEIVWDMDQEELNLAAKTFSDDLTTQAMAPDVDVDDLTYGPLAAKVRDGKRELTRLTKKAQENQAGYEKVYQELQQQQALKDKSKYDTAVMDDWLKRFKNAKTIEERNKMLNNPDDSPYAPAYSEWDLALATKPLYSTDPTSGMRYMDEEVWGNRIYTYITGQDGAGYYEKYKLPGESPETFADRMAQKFGEDTQLVPDIYRYKPPAKPKSGSGSGSSKSYGFSPNYDKATGAQYSQTKPVNILYLKTPKGLPPSSKAGVVRQRIDPKTQQVTPITEQITVNSIYYDANNVLTVSIIRYDKEGKQIGSGENVPYKDNKSDYDNFAGFDLQERLDAKIAEEEAKLAGGSTGSKTAAKPAAKSTGAKSGKDWSKNKVKK